MVQKNTLAEKRKAMVAAVRHGASLREVARRFRVGRATVSLRFHRAGQQRLERVTWRNRPPVPHHTRRTNGSLEERVLTLRRELAASDLGEFGPEAIHRALAEQGLDPIPSARTIARILQRRGALDSRRRVRRASPPRG